MKLRQDTDTFEATGTPSLATVDTATYRLHISALLPIHKVTLKYSPVPYVHNSSKSLSVSTGDTLDPESTSLFIPNLFIFAQILNCIMSSIIITTLDLLLLQNTQFPHTRRSPHNVQHSSSIKGAISLSREINFDRKKA